MHTHLIASGYSVADTRRFQAVITLLKIFALHLPGFVYYSQVVVVYD